MRIAIIPARGGSKRIPRKNIKMFAGKPMLAHAVSLAKLSNLFDRVVVSTDDDEIANIAQDWGAEVPFSRPAELAGDHVSTVPVIAHGIKTCQNLGWDISHVCCIYPSAPFIDISDLRGALELLNASEADYSFTVADYPSPIQRALQINTDKRVRPFYPDFELVRTQDLEPAYFDAGQFYWGRVNAWITNENIHSSGLGYMIPNWRAVDIDTPDDWQRAESIFNYINKINAF